MHYRGHRFNPCSGNQDATCCGCGQKKKKKSNEPVVLLLSSSVSFWGLGQHLPQPQFPHLPSILPRASDLLLQVNSLKARWWGASRPPVGSPLSHWPAGAKRSGVSILGLGPACIPGAQMLGDSGLQGKPCSGWWWVEGRQAAWAAGLWEAARLSLGERHLLLAVHLLFPPGCGGEAGNSKGGGAGVRLVSKRGREALLW